VIEWSDGSCPARGSAIVVGWRCAVDCKFANAVCSRDCLSIDVVSWGSDAAVAAVCERLDEEAVELKPAGLWRVVELVGSARCLVWARCSRGKGKRGCACRGRLLDTISHVVVRSFTRGKACPLSHEYVCFKLVSCHLC
jgi:hypothetical protein